MSVKAVFQAMDAAIRERGSEFVAKIRGVIQYRVKGDGNEEVWTVDLKNGSGSVKEGETGGKPDLIVTMKESAFLEIAAGKLQPQQAFMKGLLKLKGSIALGMKLQTVIEAARKANPDLAAKITGTAGAASGGGGGGGSSGSKEEVLAPGLQSSAVFEEIRNYIRENGSSVVKNIKGIIEFHIGDKVVTLDLKNGSGNIVNGPSTADKPNLVMTISDENFAALALGQLNAQTAFMKGLLKLRGNVGLAMKLSKVLAAARPKPKL